MPLSSLQTLYLSVEEEAAAALETLGIALNDAEGFAARVRELARGSSESSAEATGWRGVTIGGRFFAWDGPSLFALDDRPGVPTPPSLPDALRGEQMVPSFGLRAKLNHHLGHGRIQVFETDRKGWRREVIYTDDPDQVLFVHPDASSTSAG